MEDNNINNEIQQNIDHINNNFDFKSFNKDTLSTILPVYTYNYSFNNIYSHIVLFKYQINPF